MNRDNRENDEDEESGQDGWAIAGAIGAGLAGVAALAGGLYWLSSRTSDDKQKPQQAAEQPIRRRQTSQESGPSTSFISNLLADIDLQNPCLEGNIKSRAWGIRDVPENPIINNLDSLLADIYVRFIGLRVDDFRLHYKVFDKVFQKVHYNMKKVDSYYSRYSSTVQVAGSHFDRLRIKKPDEFDVDIIIGLPLNIRVDHYNPANSDITLNDLFAGFVTLKMGKQFERLPYRDEWQVNQALFTWKDDEYYLLRSKFSYWFKSLVYRALDQFGCNRSVEVDGVSYNIGVSESGPAMTLKITDTYKRFKLDVDLVPALKFPGNRWPDWGGYRSLTPYNNELFMVVPKPIKTGVVNNVTVTRSWRMSLIYQEKELLHGTYNLRQIIRYLKKLRDAENMEHIASYYIKTLFLWEVAKRGDPNFWRQAHSKLFIIMVKKFKEALEAREIPYFWNSTHNLIENVKGEILAGYAAKLKKLVQILENPAQYKEVAAYLLTASELLEYSPILWR